MVKEINKLKFLGWANSWEALKCKPEIVKKCNHKKTVIHHTRTGSKNEVKCEECGYYYYYDSSG